MNFKIGETVYYGRYKVTYIAHPYESHSIGDMCCLICYHQINKGWNYHDHEELVAKDKDKLVLNRVLALTGKTSGLWYLHPGSLKRSPPDEV